MAKATALRRQIAVLTAKLAATMTAHEYAEAIQQLGLSHSSAGPVLGITPRQSQRYAAGKQQVAVPVAKLLRLLLRHKITINNLKDI